MTQLKVIDKDGKSVGELKIEPLLVETRVNRQLIHDVVVGYMRNRRQGNASSLTRAEVKASGKKPWRQKGTGRARAGSAASPLWKGGGVVFGPKPRD
jgi:large subunit ribosomal protein L4